SNEAITFAIEVQRSFHEQAVWSDGDPMKFRIALSRGEISIKNRNVHGHCVNVAARLQSVAAPGEIVLTTEVSETLDEATRPRLMPMGPRVLKNISGSVEVYSVAAMRKAAPEDPVRELQPSRPRQPSVAVLALANLSGDPANEHLCEG